MQRAAPWLIRLGAVLLVLSPFLPQADPGGGGVGAWAALAGLAGKIGGIGRLAAALGLFAPVPAGAVLLAGASLPRGGPAALRLATLGVLLALSFVLSTLGSILLTDAATHSVTPSFPLAIALFAAPLALSGAAASRWMQGGLDRATGTFERGALAVLLLLHGLFLADCGWGFLLLAVDVPNGTIRLLAGAWAGPLGAVLALAGVLLAPLPPRAAVDTAAASG